MQRPAALPGAELESAMEGLDISRGHRVSPPQPQAQAQAQTSREPSRPDSDHRHHDAQGGQGGGSSQHQHSGGQPAAGGAIKASRAEVWYLKSINFTSPSSGKVRKYNVITQNYNGCDLPSFFHPLSLARTR